MAGQHTERSKLLPETKISKKNRCCICLTNALAVGSFLCVAGTLVVFFATSIYSYPIHASCRVQWTFAKPCDAVKSALINQMETWHLADNCANGGEKCLYNVSSSTETTLTGTHETPVKHYVDDLKFDFAPTSDNNCSVQGHSTSELWYAILDYGTNYCNLRNLIEGANLHTDPDFTETTRDAICTQYSSADCDVY